MLALIGTMLLTLVLPAAASTGRVQVALPSPQWVVESLPNMVITGVAQTQRNSYVRLTIRAGVTCPAQPPGKAPTNVPGVGEIGSVLAPSDIVSGPYRVETSIQVKGRGVICAYLSEEQPLGAPIVTADTARLSPRYRVPARASGRYPFILSYPRRPGGTLVSYLGSGHSFSRFVATCFDRGAGNRSGPHDYQRFTVKRAVVPDPISGRFQVSGIAKADNSDNYDRPPQPYYGRARLTIKGQIDAGGNDFDPSIGVKASFTLVGRALSCKASSARSLSATLRRP
jgi:hypothetical protein